MKDLVSLKWKIKDGFYWLVMGGFLVKNEGQFARNMYVSKRSNSKWIKNKIDLTNLEFYFDIPKENFARKDQSYKRNCWNYTQERNWYESAKIDRLSLSVSLYNPRSIQTRNAEGNLSMRSETHREADRKKNQRK